LEGGASWLKRYYFLFNLSGKEDKLQGIALAIGTYYENREGPRV
jgi:hypothetical protein